MSELSKKFREISVFREFIEKASIEVDGSSVMNRDPPEPDIWCLGKDCAPMAFELMELCSPAVAQLYGRRNPAASWAMFIADLDVQKVMAKLTKRYVTEASCHLLCYVDGRSGPTDDQLIADLRKIDFSSQENFSSVWFMGGHEVLRVF